MAKQQTLTIVVPDDAPDPVDLIVTALAETDWTTFTEPDNLVLHPSDFHDGAVVIIEEP